MRCNKERKFKKCIFSVVVVRASQWNSEFDESILALKATYDKLIRDIVPVISIRTEPTYVTIIPKLQQILLYLHLLQNFAL